ncbi:MAG: hypothetical protein IH946_06015 [Bacteroidetes bacterium]|nr:hypothetical protein [Bacteroidota bacterium]
MRSRFTRYFPVILLVLVASKCNEPGTLDVDYNYEYFPLKLGQTVIYDVDSVFLDDFTLPPTFDTTTYQIKETVESTFIDNEGRISHRIVRYKRYDTTSVWKDNAVWFATRTNSRVELVEDNNRFIKMTFPAKEGKKWLGNVYLDIATEKCLPDYDNSNWEYEILEIDKRYSINGLDFDSTLIVEQINDTTDNLVEMHYSFERYAKGVGLIEKEFWHLWTNNLVFKPWLVRAECGFVIKIRINSFILADD